MINTTLCYIERDGKYLLLCRNKKKNDLNEGKWIGVGGKCEPGESPEACVRRETFEETGLTLGKLHFYGIIHFRSDTWEDEEMYLYRGELSAADRAGALPDCDEGELVWMKKKDLDALPQWEGDRIFHRLLDEEIPFFSLKLVYSGEKLLSAVLNGKQNLYK